MQDDCVSYKCVNASTVECTCRGRQLGDPRGEAALAPLKGELAARTGCLRGFLAQFNEQTPPVSLTLNHLPFQGRQGHLVPAGR